MLGKRRLQRQHGLKRRLVDDDRRDKQDFSHSIVVVQESQLMQNGLPAEKMLPAQPNDDGKKFVLGAVAEGQVVIVVTDAGRNDIVGARSQTADVAGVDEKLVHVGGSDSD